MMVSMAKVSTVERLASWFWNRWKISSYNCSLNFVYTVKNLFRSMSRHPLSAFVHIIISVLPENLNPAG